MLSKNAFILGGTLGMVGKGNSSWAAIYQKISKNIALVPLYRPRMGTHVSE